MSETKLSFIYYSPKGYWKGFAAIQKLAKAGNVSEKVARNWLMKQALWQVYLPAPHHIPRPKFDVPMSNKVHQAGSQIYVNGRRRCQPLQRSRTSDF